MFAPDKSRQDEIFSTLRAPTETVLQRYGIQTKRKGDGGKWVNLSWCPWCGHGRNTHDNYQCGVVEESKGNGLLHAVNCLHPHDSPGGDATPHYADFLVALGELTPDEATWVKEQKSRTAATEFVRKVTAPYLDGRRRAAPEVAPVVPGSTKVKPASLLAVDEVGLMNKENNAKTRRRLRANPAALDYVLAKRGYDEETIERFKLGLSEPYMKDGKPATSDALAAPLLGPDGRFYKKYVNYAIPKVTVDNRAKPRKAWSPGDAKVYYDGDVKERRWLFICDGPKDLWALAQLLRGHELESQLVLASSTNGGAGLPEAWKDPDYWGWWERVYAGHDNDQPDPLYGTRAGDEHALGIVRASGREVMRVTPPEVKDWNDWVLQGHSAEDFRQLLAGGVAINLAEAAKEDVGQMEAGRFAANLVDVEGAYHNGYLYSTTRSLVRTIENGEPLHKYATFVVRSDRTEHVARRRAAPAGTPEHDIVYQLSGDGTLLSRLPVWNPSNTWSHESVERYLARKDRTPPLGQLLRQVVKHLRGAVWLPHSDNFTLVGCAVVASFVQQIFEAVPLILVTGPAGSGKSELATALRRIGANCPDVLGVATAATLARHIDSARGLTVIDDLEQIGNPRDASFSELVQTLKLSYKKSTAMKMVTEFRGNGVGYQRKFNFFGVKVIGNTRGTDSILGTRMLTIETRKMPEGIVLDAGAVLEGASAAELRDHLHTWAFSNVKEVAARYHFVIPNKSNRAEEIAAPLRVVALLSEDPEIIASLERALAHQGKVKASPDAPEDVMADALESIIRRSIEVRGLVPTWVSVQQVMLEMSLLVHANYGKDYTTSISVIQKPEWVGMTLKQQFSDLQVDQARTTLYDRTIRAYKLTDEFLRKVQDRIRTDAPEVMEKPLRYDGNFKAFCVGCQACMYRDKGCTMQEAREVKDGLRVLPAPDIRARAKERYTQQRKQRRGLV